MNEHTQRAKDWLDRRYRRDSQGAYSSHQPISGPGIRRSEPNPVLRMARTYRILSVLEQLQFDSVLDVGGGEGYLSSLIRNLFSPSTVHQSDLSVEASHRAREIFNVQGVAADAVTLPVEDESYDLVVCSEVIEHLSRPALAIAELARVAKRFVVLTTAEFCPAGAIERWLRLRTLDKEYPHAEMNWFTADDFRLLLGRDVQMCSQFTSLAYEFGDADVSASTLRDVLPLLTETSSIDVDHVGVVVVLSKTGDVIDFSRRPGLDRSRQILAALARPAVSSAADHGAFLDDELVRRLICLACQGALTRDGDSRLSCQACGAGYDVNRHVPVMLTDVTTDDGGASRERQIIERFSERDPSGTSQVRELIAMLHSGELRDNGPLTRRVAAQLLRAYWFWSRDETLRVKALRILHRLRPEAPRERVGAVSLARSHPRTSTRS